MNRLISFLCFILLVTVEAGIAAPLKKMKSQPDCINELIDRIAPEQLENFELVVRKTKDKDYYSARWQGQRVFIKKIDPEREPYHQISEIRWLALINSFGLGPKLIGTTYLNDKPAMVMEFLDGINERQARNKKTFVLTRSMREEMRQAAKALEANNIFPNDLQFIFTKSGHAVVVDPEWYYSPDLPLPLKPLPQPLPRLETVRLNATRLVRDKFRLFD